MIRLQEERGDVLHVWGDSHGLVAGEHSLFIVVYSNNSMLLDGRTAARFEIQKTWERTDRNCPSFHCMNFQQAAFVVVYAVTRFVALSAYLRTKITQRVMIVIAVSKWMLYDYVFLAETGIFLVDCLISTRIAVPFIILANQKYIDPRPLLLPCSVLLYVL